MAISKSIGLLCEPIYRILDVYTIRGKKIKFRFNLFVFVLVCFALITFPLRLGLSLSIHIIICLQTMNRNKVVNSSRQNSTIRNVIENKRYMNWCSQIQSLSLSFSGSIEIKWKLLNYSMVQWWCHSFKRMLKQSVKVQTSIALSYQERNQYGSHSSQFDHHHHHCYYLLLQKCSSFATESSKFLFIYVLCVICLELVESFEAMTARLASISPAPIDLQCVRSRTFCVHSLPPQR